MASIRLQHKALIITAALSLWRFTLRLVGVNDTAIFPLIHLLVR